MLGLMRISILDLHNCYVMLCMYPIVLLVLAGHYLHAMFLHWDPGHAHHSIPYPISLPTAAWLWVVSIGFGTAADGVLRAHYALFLMHPFVGESRPSACDVEFECSCNSRPLHDESLPPAVE